MKQHLKAIINLVASLLLMVIGTARAAQAEDIWLDFSPPEAEIRTQATHRTEALQRWQQMKHNSEQAAKSIALNFSLPTASTPPTPAVAQTPDKPKPTPPPPKANPQPSPKPSTTLSEKVTALRRAIIGQESGGNFRAINPDSGALGYGQIMEDNLAPWTKAALGKALTPEEFLANPELQIKTIEHKLKEYLERELAYTGEQNLELVIRRVASIWYSGNPNLWNNTRPQYYEGQRYPSIASYTRSVWQRYQKEIG